MAVTGLDRIFTNLDLVVDKIIPERCEDALALVLAHLIEWLKAEHPWQNQTGDTEAGIDAVITEFGPLLIEAEVFTTTFYAPFLELAHGGQWAWMWDTILRHRDEMDALMHAVFNGISVGELVQDPGLMANYESYKESIRGLRSSSRSAGERMPRGLSI